jgi:hypothetical protein
MTARQQIARLLPLALLIVLVIAGLRGAVPAPRWNGPLKADGFAIGIVLEVIFAALLFAVHTRDRAARRAAEAGRYRTAEAGRYTPVDPAADIEPPRALRVTLRYVLTLGMAGVAAVLISALHLHFFSGAIKLPKQSTTPKFSLRLQHGVGGSFNLTLGPVLYGLLIVVLVAAVVVSVWWSMRLRRPAAPRIVADGHAEELREAVEEGRAALAAVDDARAAIIACYVAMERRLADRGTERGAADTPDELLARAVAAGTVRGGAADRLTSLFYEARFSSHPLGGGQREAASAALDELAGELKAKPEPAPEPGGDRV